jgi:hypothetical protein
MKRIFFLLFFSFIIIHSGFNQQKVNPGNRIFFKGLVMDAITLSPVGNSQIMINRAFSSLSNQDGSFSFYVNRNDTVLFKSLGYKSTVLYISDTLSGTEFVAGIYMKSDTVSIGEVVIIPRLINLRSEILSARSKTPSVMDNARYNVAIGAYQARTTQGNLGDPASNYELLRQKQKVNAYEKGGIPSDRILGLSPLLLLPAAYMLLHGLPQKPAAMQSDLTDYELDMLQKKYLETQNQRK